MQIPGAKDPIVAAIRAPWMIISSAPFAHVTIYLHGYLELASLTFLIKSVSEPYWFDIRKDTVEIPDAA
jgi:hypothetical protein